MWSYPKGFEYPDGATTPTSNNNATPDRRAPQQQEPRATHARSESSTFPSFRSSSSSSSSHRHDQPTPHNEDGHRHNHQHQQQQQYQQHREMERHPATSLATILNDQPGQSSSVGRHSPPTAQSQQRPAYFSHRPHSQSLSHIHSYPSSHLHHPQQLHQNLQQQHLQHLHQKQQQHHQQHLHQQPQHPLSTSSTFPHDHRHPHPAPTHEHDGTGHCCDAMIEIQQLRQERDWYRSLAEKTNDGSSSDSSNSNQFNGRMITSP
ncbi:hypothetical protein KI688_010087 [Linnemannia hyalina]|uniref:Uncharacterized protein n=1 Tax=Linnemannia hyalina TaxID=64524 RepID=A0A9P8BUW8_9FUNG|nr:hypothetical protein KI688_010087 [Linnemannia hyalina]